MTVKDARRKPIPKESKSTADNGIRFVLLAHSFGNVVVEEYISTGGGEGLGLLFDTFLMSSSASGAHGHAEWVEKIEFARNLLILLNREDPILLGAGLLKHSPKLGRQSGFNTGLSSEVASNAKYLDVSNTKAGHRYYLQRNAGRSHTLKRILKSVFTDRNPVIEGSGVSREPGSQIFTIE